MLLGLTLADWADAASLCLSGLLIGLTRADPGYCIEVDKGTVPVAFSPSKNSGLGGDGPSSSRCFSDARTSARFISDPTLDSGFLESAVSSAFPFYMIGGGSMILAARTTTSGSA